MEKKYWYYYEDVIHWCVECLLKNQTNVWLTSMYGMEVEMDTFFLTIPCNYFISKAEKKNIFLRFPFLSCLLFSLLVIEIKSKNSIKIFSVARVLLSAKDLSISLVSYTQEIIALVSETENVYITKLSSILVRLSVSKIKR